MSIANCRMLVLTGILAAAAHCRFAELSPAADLESLQVLSGGYPHAYFFRSSEGLAAGGRISYERWDACFSRLMGIEGKVLDEEVPGRSLRNVQFFTRFKREHPDQLVLLHYNGNARDPRYRTEKYFAGHWLYYNGARIVGDVPAEEGETEIAVNDPALFRLATGRYRKANEDVGLCMLDADGKPDWQRCEQVQLLDVDAAGKTIRVRRGCFGTKPLAFPAGRSYAAAHMTEGPWGGRSHLMWYYNHSTKCPRDQQGRTCDDVVCDELAAWFSETGELAAFDGLEFDVLHHQAGGRSPVRGADCDADGRPDFGVFDGVNVYGVGVVEFCRKLREKLGPQRIIQADGTTVRSQRAFRILNGIESEGWPWLGDPEVRDWSGGLNRHLYWRENAHPPVFNYINHKFSAAGPRPGQRIQPDVPPGTHRLVLAVATFTDSAVCYSFVPDAEPGELLGIWDELRKGTERQLGWLGRPLGPAVRLARRRPNVLACRTPAELLPRLSGAGLKFELDGDRVKVSAEGSASGELRFRVRGVPCDGPDLFVTTTASGSPMCGYPPEAARLMWVGIAPDAGMLTLPDLPPSGMCLRGGKETELVPETGASLRFNAKRRLGGQTLDAYMAHPPYRGKTGYTFWYRDVRVPRGGRLELSTGMGEKSPGRSDGVTFHVLAAEIRSGRPGTFVELFKHVQVAAEWMPHDVSLADWAGKQVRLKFVADCGPADNSTTDHAYWGGVALLGPEGRRGATDAVRFMSWLGDGDFESGFYFSNVRSDVVDLEWLVEGTEPIWITSVNAYHHIDAIYREFEHGLVLANPSPRPYTFDLDVLLPGRKYRRLRGSARQDPKVNDGTPVAGKLTLRPREGLFLTTP